MAELLEIPVRKADDPGGARLAAVLNAERSVERWSARRTLLGRLVIAASVPMAYWLQRGQPIASAVARVVMSVWAAGFVGLLAAAAAAARAQGLVDRLLTRSGGRRVRTDD